MKIKIIIVLFATLLISCSSKYGFLERYPVVAAPIMDTLDFSNYIPTKKLNKRKVRKLHLDKIFSKEELKNRNTKIGVISRPKLSETFKSVLLYSFVEGSQLSSVLVNYSDTYQFVDYKLVSFAENSDGIVKTTSVIHKDSIVSTEYNLFSSEKSNLNFSISSDGKITRK